MFEEPQCFMADLQFVLLSIPILAFVCGVGILLLLLCYLKRNPSFSLFWKKRDINQCQDRVEKRRKGETLKGLTACQREADEAKQVLSLRQRHLGQFRQLLCPDPSCEVGLILSAENLKRKEEFPQRQWNSTSRSSLDSRLQHPLFPGFPALQILSSPVSRVVEDTSVIHLRMLINLKRTTGYSTAT
ncbi:spermatogenesis-associated protein 31D3-like isoform X3 [Talpa occidentalis]|uniref:spermatogenesis-associated protein 31D3-like isoform X3 n=1 Tax=Talpa occidentalis TaxID=50954 RepID=UPI0023F86F03|nr:spermatogenesis-associated protein 31D3-like isoform X3 [Talpa occidentalis]